MSKTNPVIIPDSEVPRAIKALHEIAYALKSLHLIEQHLKKISEQAEISNKMKILEIQKNLQPDKENE